MLNIIKNVPPMVRDEYEIDDINNDGLPEHVAKNRCLWEPGVHYDTSTPEYAACFEQAQITLSGDTDFTDLQRITNNNNLDILVGHRYRIFNPYFNPYYETNATFYGTVIGFLDFPSHVMIDHGAVTFISYTAQIQRDDGTITFADIDFMSQNP